MLFAGKKIITNQINAISYAEALNSMQSGDLFKQEGNHVKANKAYQKALEKFQKILKKDPKWETELIKYRTDEITNDLSISKRDTATKPQ